MLYIVDFLAYAYALHFHCDSHILTIRCFIMLIFGWSKDPKSLYARSLLLIQRCRYVEAYQVSLKLWTLEEDFILTHSVNEEFLEVLSRMESCRQRRKALVVSTLNFAGGWGGAGGGDLNLYGSTEENKLFSFLCLAKFVGHC